MQVGGVEFIARRSTLARIWRSLLWELFAGDRLHDPPKNTDGFIKLDADPVHTPEQFEQMLALLKLLEVGPGERALAPFFATVQKYAVPLGTIHNREKRARSGEW